MTFPVWDLSLYVCARPYADVRSRSTRSAIHCVDSLCVVLSHSDDKVKGFFWSKESRQDTEELASTVEIDVVAVPRPPASKPGA
jgi:hypothetical protein